MDLYVGKHGFERGAQRGRINQTEIEYILLHGQRYHRGGGVFVYLRRRDIPPNDLADDRWARLEGCAVLTDRTVSQVITVWRNRRDGLKRIRRKAPYGRREKLILWG